MQRLRGNLGVLLLGLAASVAMLSPAFANRLTIALSANAITMDPHGSNTVGTTLSVVSNIYTPLVIRGPDMKLQPALATAWRALDDLTWQFDLKPGVTFPDGEPLDAAAVKWNLERVNDPAVKSPMKPWFSQISEVRIVSPTQLDIVTKAPYAALPDQLAMFFLMAPKWTAGHDPAVEAMGTGPYDLVEYKSGDHMTLKAKADYWGEKPKFDELLFRVIPEDASRIAALLTGDVDLVSDFPPSEIKRINDSGKAHADAIPSTRMAYIKFNNLKPPFKDNNALRLALNYGVDKKAILDAVWNGYGSLLNCQPLNEAYFGYNPELKPIPYDPAKARQLLAKAGYPNGLSVKLEVPLARYLQAQDISQAVAAQLSEIGVNVQITEIEFGRWITKYVNAHNMEEMSYIGQSWSTLDADGMLSLFEPGNPFAYYDNQEFAELLKQGRTTTDRAKRVAIYKKATEVFCADPAQLLLFNQPTTYGESKRINWHARGDDWYRAVDVDPR